MVNTKRMYLWLVYGLGSKAVDLYISMIVWVIAGLENEQVDFLRDMVINDPMLFIFGFIPVNVGFVGFFTLFLVWVEKLTFEPSENVIKGSLKDKFIKVNGIIALSGGVTLIAGGWAQGVGGLIFLFSSRQLVESLYIYLLLISYSVGAMLIVTGVLHYGTKEKESLD